MEVFSSYEVKIIHSNGARHNVLTTIADSSNLANRSIFEMWEIFSDYKFTTSFNIDDDKQPDPEVVGLAIEYCDDNDDSNTPTNTNNKVATLQLCSGTIGILIQLLHLEKIPDTLRSLLANDKEFVFVGVGINDTLAMLERDYGLQCKCQQVDLGIVASRIFKKPQFFDSTLEVLARDIAEINIEKPTIPSLTLWGARNLRNEQIDYAMTKAYASYCIGNKLLKREFQRP